MKWALLVVAWLAGCGGGGEFRPAKNVASFPPTKDAFRVHEVPGECQELGSVDGEDLEDIVATTTKHGGTHYTVRVDRTRDEGYSGVIIGDVIAVDRNTSRQVSATAYRCPQDGWSER